MQISGCDIHSDLFMLECIILKLSKLRFIKQTIFAKEIFQGKVCNYLPNIDKKLAVQFTMENLFNS